MPKVRNFSVIALCSVMLMTVSGCFWHSRTTEREVPVDGGSSTTVVTPAASGTVTTSP